MPIEAGSSQETASPEVTKPPVIRAAGIMFLDPDGNVLFLRRAGVDQTGTWAFPGGHIEEGETADQAAVREVKEETDFTVDPHALRTHARRIKPVLSDVVTDVDQPLDAGPATLPPPPLVDFTTFLMQVPEQFVPTLNEEHDGYVWAKVQEPPSPLHPGCRIALDKLFMDELGIAKAMAAGDLTSPQRYMNMTLWDMRITGTGRAFRKNQKHKDETGKEITYDEHVFRPPEIYMNDEFLQRCNGLTVIWKHPKGATLNSKEFADRVVGSFLLPYLDFENEEVRGIAKVFDDEANAAMERMQLSTSPTVVFSKLGVNVRTELPDGSMLLIEGDPDLLDHLAVCEVGVWDKGGEPTGVTNDNIVRGDSDVSEESKDETKKPDATGNESSTLDKLMDALRSSVADMSAKFDAKFDEMSAKYDAIADAVKKRDEGDKDKPADPKKDSEDPAGTGAEETAADKRKDSEEDKDAKADSAALQAKIDELNATVADLSKRTPRALTSADRSAFADAQAKADSVMRNFGEQAEPPMAGEDLIAYQIRLHNKMKPHSKTWKNFDLSIIAADSTAFGEAMGQIRADAMQASLAPSDMKPGEHRMISQTMPTGHKVTTFVGAGTIFKQLSSQPRYVRRIGVPRSN